MPCKNYDDFMVEQSMQTNVDQAVVHLYYHCSVIKTSNKLIFDPHYLYISYLCIFRIFKKIKYCLCKSSTQLNPVKWYLHVIHNDIYHHERMINLCIFYLFNFLTLNINNNNNNIEFILYIINGKQYCLLSKEFVVTSFVYCNKI